MQLNKDQVRADEALLQLGLRLRADGYRFTCVTPATQARVNARADAQQARTLRDVFGWSRPFAASLLSPGELEQLRLARVLEAQGTLWRSTVRWSSLTGTCCLANGQPRRGVLWPGQLPFRPADTRSFEKHARARAACRRHRLWQRCRGVADCSRRPTRSGLRSGHQPYALRYTAINAALAGVANVSVERSDLLNDIAGTFDLIVANPPYMIDAGQRAYRHGGGALGAELSLRIVEQARERLSPGGTLLLYTGVAIVEGRDALLEAMRLRLAGPAFSWFYRELDPDVFGEQLLEPGYEQVERIAAVALTVTRRG